MRRHPLLVLFLLLVLCGLHAEGVGADDDTRALDVLNKAIEHSGEELIRAGEFLYEVRSKGDVPSASEIADVNRRARDQLMAASDAATDPKVKQHLKELAESGNDFGPAMVANADLKLQFYFAFNGPLIGGDHYLERRTWDPVTKSFGKVDYSLVRRYGEGKSDCIWLDQHLSGKVGPVDDIIAVQQAPHYLGRLSGTIMSVGPEPMLARLEDIELIEGKEFEGHPAVEVRCSLRDFHTSGLANIKYLIVPAMGYVVPSVQEFDAENEAVFECLSEEYFGSADPSIWFPSKCVTTTVSEGKRRIENYTFEPGNVKINEGVAESRFKVEIPAGADIYLTATGKTLKANDRVEVGIDDIAELSSNPAFHAFGTSPPRVSSKPEASGFTISSLVFAGGLLSCVVVAMLFYRQSGGRAAVVLFLVSSAAAQSGCVSEAKEVKQAAHPKVVDLGKVASEQQSVDFGFQIENPNPNPMVLTLVPMCGCTLVDTPSLTIDSGSAEQVKGRLLLHGKSGLFETQIQVRRSVAPDNEDGNVVTLRAVILGQWVAMPKRVILSPTGTGSLRLIAPSALWADVNVQPAENSIQIQQVSSHIDKEQNEIRDFEIKVCNDGREHRRSSKIVLHTRGERDPFLSVPVLVEGPGGLY